MIISNTHVVRVNPSPSTLLGTVINGTLKLSYGKKVIIKLDLHLGWKTPEVQSGDWTRLSRLKAEVYTHKTNSQ